jgi:hypothetical protein
MIGAWNANTYPQRLEDASFFLAPTDEVKRLWENWVVPPGLASFLPLFPALKRWAKLDRPSGAGFTDV